MNDLLRWPIKRRLRGTIIGKVRPLRPPVANYIPGQAVRYGRMVGLGGQGRTERIRPLEIARPPLTVSYHMLLASADTGGRIVVIKCGPNWRLLSLRKRHSPGAEGAPRNWQP